MVLPRLGSATISNDSLRLSASWRNVRSIVASSEAKVISSASTVTVPDSILDRRECR